MYSKATSLGSLVAAYVAFAAASASARAMLASVSQKPAPALTDEISLPKMD